MLHLLDNLEVLVDLVFLGCWNPKIKTIYANFTSNQRESRACD